MIKAIYVITNKINGKQYVGQSVHPDKRWWEHKNLAKTKRDDYPIHLAISKYGEENFSFEIIKWTENYDEEEKEMIKKLNTISPNGYNVASGGSSNVMYGEDNPRNTMKEETIKNIIKDLKDGKLSDRAIAKKFGCSDKIVSDINHGRTHRQDNESYPIRVKHGLQKLTLENVDEIIDQLINTTKSYPQIARQYNVSDGVIYHINKGLTFYNDKYDYPLRKTGRIKSNA